MRLSYHKRAAVRIKARTKNRARIRKKVEGTAQRPRFTVFRSANNLYAQVIDDSSGKTIAAASTLGLKLSKHGGNREAAKQVGAEVAKLAKNKGIENVVFDRSGYVYHGRIKAVAEGAREAGLNF